MANFKDSNMTFKSNFKAVQTIHGKDGKDGKDGLSAYEIALQHGFEGTEEEWLASLKGADGIVGKDGYTPQKGIDYFDGKDGIDGKTPVKGEDYFTEEDKEEIVNETTKKAPVKSVNSKTGDVVLNATDVHALPDTVIIPTIPENVSAFKNDAGYLTEHQSLAEYPKRTESEKHTADVVSAHNTNTETHNDIRLLIQGLTDRINAIADSDDTTLDQLSEIVAYIKSNKSLIEAITTEKISYSDIINNLESNVSNKPLSAAMGVSLKALIDAIVVPTKVSELQNDSNFINKTTFDEALAEVEKPFVITGTADLLNNTVTNVGKTFAEIEEANERNDHIFLDLDVSQVIPGQRCFANLVSFLSGAYAIFEAVISISGSESRHLAITFNASGIIDVSMVTLARESQLPDFTFVASDTVPTVDDRNIITFVIEE